MNSLQYAQQQSLEQQLPILFYSNFSSSSKTFLNLLNKYKLQPHINLVCIDHKKFRDKLNRSKILKINKVPCVIKLYQGGTVEKYDDKAVFDWLDILINKVVPPSQLQPVTEPEVVSKTYTTQKVSEKIESPVIKPRNTTQVIDNNMETEQSVKLPKQEIKSSFGEGKTSIGELMTDDDDEYEGSEEKTNETEPIRKPISSLRTDKGNYEIEDFGEHEVRNNPNNLRGVKQNTETAAKSDIISLAQSMQKSRELEDSKSVNPGHINLEKSRHKT